MSHRTPIDELKLQGNASNLARAIKREQNDKAAPATGDRKAEIAQLDDLILRAMRSCRKGFTHRGKSNPAFSHLQLLVRVRESLLRGNKPSKKSTADVVSEADKILGLTPREVN
jgi:hypothetical protein